MSTDHVQNSVTDTIIDVFDETPELAKIKIPARLKIIDTLATRVLDSLGDDVRFRRSFSADKFRSTVTDIQQQRNKSAI